MSAGPKSSTNSRTPRSVARQSPPPTGAPSKVRRRLLVSPRMVNGVRQCLENTPASPWHQIPNVFLWPCARRHGHRSPRRAGRRGWNKRVGRRRARVPVPGRSSRRGALPRDDRQGAGRDREEKNKDGSRCSFNFSDSSFVNVSRPPYIDSVSDIVAGLVFDQAGDEPIPSPQFASSALVSTCAGPHTRLALRALCPALALPIANLLPRPGWENVILIL